MYISYVVNVMETAVTAHARSICCTVLLRNNCFKKLNKINRATPVLGSFCNKGVDSFPGKLLIKESSANCFSVNFMKFLRTIFLQYNCLTFSRTKGVRRTLPSI